LSPITRVRRITQRRWTEVLRGDLGDLLDIPTPIIALPHIENTLSGDHRPRPRGRPLHDYRSAQRSGCADADRPYRPLPPASTICLPRHRGAVPRKSRGAGPLGSEAVAADTHCVVAGLIGSRRGNSRDLPIASKPTPNRTSSISRTMGIIARSNRHRDLSQATPIARSRSWGGGPIARTRAQAPEIADERSRRDPRVGVRV
jgi:hypothetical protein